MLNDLLDVKYATLYNLFSPEATTEKGSVLKVTKQRDKYLNDGFIAPLTGHNGNTRQTQFFTITPKGAEFADRKEDYKSIDKKASSSINHEFCKIDVAMAFKRLFGVRKFDYQVNVNHHFTDIFFQIGKHKYYVEIEVKDRPGKVIKYMNDAYKGFKESCRVLVVYVPWDYKERGYIFRRPQAFTEEMAYLADKEIGDLVCHKRFKTLPDYMRFIHIMNIHRLNESVWYTPSGLRTGLIHEWNIKGIKSAAKKVYEDDLEI